MGFSWSFNEKTETITIQVGGVSMGITLITNIIKNTNG
jgi:hypothetical protein